MFLTIRIRILGACVALVVLALVASAFVNYFIVRKYNDDSIDRNLMSIADGHAQAISDWVTSKTQMIASLQDAVLSQDPVPALRQIKAAGRFLHVSVGYADKSVKFSDSTSAPAGFDPTSRPWYLAASQARKPVVLPYFSMKGEFLVAFVVPVLRDGVLKAVVMGEVSMDSVIANVASIHPTPASFGTLIDGRGRIVADSDPQLTLKPVSKIAAALNDVSPSSLSAAKVPLEVQVGGAAKLARVRPVPGTDWYLIIALDKAEATAGMRSMVNASVVTLFALVGVATLVVGAITTTLFRRLTHVESAMMAIGSGTADLTRRLPVHGRDEIASIARSFNSFVDKLQGAMRQIREVSESVRGNANEIAAGSCDLSARTESAAANLQQTAASMDEITVALGHSADAARLADERAATASNIASDGSAAVTEVFGTMGSIEGASGRIGDIIGVIDGIAFQTNILALNAAVEAARAGEQGRGFAVVAQEVRSLAQRSAHAAREVKALVESTVTSVARGSAQVRRADETMRKIVTNVADVTTIIAEVTHAANEQTRRIAEVNGAVAQLDEMVQYNAALVEQSAGAAAALQVQANELARLVGQFEVA